MKFRRIFSPIALVLLTGVTLATTPDARLPWVVVTFLCFGGILLFDQYEEVTKQWMNTLVFFASLGLVLGAVLAPAPEAFWRNFAGAMFLSSLLFEQNALPWSGFGPFRTTITPALIFLMFILAQSIPYLGSEITYSFSILAILIAAYLELFCIFRENSAMNSGSFMAAIRAASSGIGTVFYTFTFLPGIAREMPFNYLFLLLPILAVIVSIFAALLQHWRRRHILFYCNWSVFVFWAALTGETNRFFASVAALISGVWAIMMTPKGPADPADVGDFYLKLSAWGIPGSMLFSLIVFSLAPSKNELVQQGSAIWLLSFVIFWSGLRRFEFSEEKFTEHFSGSWRSRLALVVSILGAGLLAGTKIWPEIISQVWLQNWSMK